MVLESLNSAKTMDRFQTKYEMRNINHPDDEEFDIGHISLSLRNATVQPALLTGLQSLSLSVLPYVLRHNFKTLGRAVAQSIFFSYT